MAPTGLHIKPHLQYYTVLKRLSFHDIDQIGGGGCIRKACVIWGLFSVGVCIGACLCMKVNVNMWFENFIDFTDMSELQQMASVYL